MSKTSDRLYQSMIDALNAATARAQTPSQYENDLRTDYNNLNSFIDRKDYRNPQAAGVATGMLPLADYQKQLHFGQPATVPGVDPHITANQNSLQNAQLEQDYGNAYEQKIGDLSNQRTGMLGTLQNLYDQRMGIGIAGTQAGLNATANQPQGFDWFSLVGPAVNATLQGLSAARGKGGSPPSGSFTPPPSPAGGMI